MDYKDYIDYKDYKLAKNTEAATACKCLQNIKFRGKSKRSYIYNPCSSSRQPVDQSQASQNTNG